MNFLEVLGAITLSLLIVLAICWSLGLVKFGFEKVDKE